MITSNTVKRKCSCDNCNREMPCIKYRFSERKRVYVELVLCEDCSNAVVNLFHGTMESGKNFKYDLDEITEIKEEL